MEITTLIENSKENRSSDLEAEHGVSLYIETSSTRLLFDTGKSDRFLKNARKMNVSVSDADMLVISHGHYDHGGGLEYFFGENDKAPVYMKEAAFSRYYAKRGIFKRYIGLDRRLYDLYRERFVFTAHPAEPKNNIFILPEIADIHQRPSGNRVLFEKQGRKLLPDRFEHELVLVIRENDGLVVFSGCSHRGILNMVETVEDRFGTEKIKALIGGFHLVNPAQRNASENDEIVREIGRSLSRKTQLRKIFTGHCTGEKPYSLLKEEMGGKLDSFRTGKVISL